jgi:hypothetical protein
MSLLQSQSKIKKSILRLEHWIEDNRYLGYDPGDGLNSFLRPMTFGNLFLDRLFLQLIQRSPINLRPLVGVKPKDSFIARGYMTWGYVIMFKLTEDESYRQKAMRCIEHLLANSATGFEQYCWGKTHDFASRGGMQKKFEPITVWTSLIGLSILEAYSTFNQEKYLTIAQSICDWILERPRNKTSTGVCINYTAYGDGTCTIHNQSMLAAAMLAKTAKHRMNDNYLKVARDAIEYTCSRQLDNGSWYYGEEDKYHWIDNFHTAYILDALKCYIESTGDKTYENNLVRGFWFFINNFFESNGRPKYYHDRVYPIDSQCVSQAIESLANFSEFDEDSLEMAIKVACWAIDNMQDKTGYFYFRQYPLMTLKVPMIHWAQATTYKALALLLFKIKDKCQPA